MRDLFSFFVLFLSARYVQIRCSKESERQSPVIGLAALSLLQISECVSREMQAVIPPPIKAAVRLPTEFGTYLLYSERDMDTRACIHTASSYRPYRVAMTQGRIVGTEGREMKGGDRGIGETVIADESSLPSPLDPFHCSFTSSYNFVGRRIAPSYWFSPSQASRRSRYYS